MSSGAAILEAPPAEVPSSTTRPFYLVLGGLGLISVAVAHLPAIWKYCTSLFSLPQYEYILALPVFAAILVHSRGWYLGQLEPGSRWTSAGMFLIAGLSLETAAIFDSPWLGAIAALLALLACCYAWGGKSFAWAVLPAWAVLWLMIRIPMDYDVRLVQSLQSIAAARASVLLHLIGEPHILQGNVVETPLKRYAVEEACSGVQSLFSITACTLFFVLWSRMSWWRSLLLLIVGWWWVWVVNVARVVIVTYFNSNFDIPIDTGWMHDALGMALFALTLGLIYSSGRFLWFFFPYGIFGRRDGVDPDELKPSNVDQYKLPTRFPNLAATPLASPLLILFYAGVITLLLLPQLRIPEAIASPTQLNDLSKDFAPAKSGNWELVPDSFQQTQRRADSQWGARSQSWRYRNGARELIVSLDYPYMGWHELTGCYVDSGWKLDSRELVDFSSFAISKPKYGDGGQCVVSKLRKPVENDFGLLFFQCFNTRLETLPAPEVNVFKLLKRRFESYRERLATLGASGSDRNSQTQAFQLQVFFQDHAPFTQQDEKDVRQLFARFRTQLEAVLPGAHPEDAR
ncbi:MAG: hypothetical protein C0483_16370 [Pirellula sp.]|nr:hypothetical protein [Pirellula sp.]